MKKLAIIFLALIMFTSCAGEKKQENNYVNEELDFSLSLPKDFESTFKIEKDGNSVNFYYGNSEKSDALFQIVRYHGMDISEEDIEKLEGNAKILFQKYDVTYVGRTVYEIEEGGKGAGAPEVLGDMKKIFDSFQTSLKEPINDEDKPFTSRYVGSLFYEGYVPNYLESRKSEKKPMTWEFTLKDKVQGEISFIPYGSGTPDLVNEKIYVAYKKDKNLKREIRIAFAKDYIEEFNFQIFVNSIRFLPGPANSVDMMSKIRESGKSGIAPELVKVSGYENRKLETDKGTYAVAENCPVVPFSAPDFKVISNYGYYSDIDEYFSSGEFSSYGDKKFYAVLDSQNNVVGLVADDGVEKNDGDKEGNGD